MVIMDLFVFMYLVYAFGGVQYCDQMIKTFQKG